MTSEIKVGGHRPSTISDLIPNIIDDDPSWRLDAKCASEPVENFYIKEGLKGVQSKKHIDNAIAFCQNCLVKIECFQYAVNNNERYGVWGGVHFGETQSRVRVKSPKQV